MKTYIRLISVHRNELKNHNKVISLGQIGYINTFESKFDIFPFIHILYEGEEKSRVVGIGTIQTLVYEVESKNDEYCKYVPVPHDRWKDILMNNLVDTAVKPII